MTQQEVENMQREQKEFSIFAFVDTPVKIIWIDRQGNMLKEETVPFVECRITTSAMKIL